MKSNQPHPRAPHPAPPAGAAPSVPISVYRELAAELQATRGMVDALNQKNHQLDRENQVLRQEMYRVVQSVMTLQPWVEASRTDLRSDVARPAPHPVAKNNGHRPTWEETAAATAIASKLRAPIEPNGLGLSADQQVTEVPASLPKVTQTKPSGGLGGVWLTLTVLVIIATAFGAGFLIMRPLLPTSR